jgi:hypothetical protein
MNGNDSTNTLIDRVKKSSAASGNPALASPGKSVRKVIAPAKISRPTMPPIAARRPT